MAAATEMRLAVGLMLASSLIFCIVDTGNKYLTGRLPVLEVVWGRFFFQFLFAPLTARRLGLGAVWRTRRPALQLLRSVLLVLSSVAMVTGLSFVPVADAVAIIMVSPLVITLLAIPVLGESVGPRRWAAVAVGFAGALVIVRPGFEGTHWALLLPFAAACSFSLYSVITRMLAESDPPETTFIYSASAGVLALSLAMPFVWVPPTAAEWGLMVGLGAVNTLAHFALVNAYQRGPASLLAPYAYSQMIWATALGFLVFGDLPDAATVAGAIVIAASGSYVFYRERQARAA